MRLHVEHSGYESRDPVGVIAPGRSRPCVSVETQDITIRIDPVL